MMNHAEMTTNLLIQYIAVGIILLATVVWIIVKFIKNRKSGSNSCCGCSLSQNCGKKEIVKKQKFNNCNTTNRKESQIKKPYVMKTIKIWNSDASERQLNEITRDLEGGATMILPTDTLYAIACDALNPKAIEKICRLKGINPEKTNLSIICSDISMAAEYARIDNKAFKMLRDNTPGPFTFLFKSSSTLPKAFKGRKVVGIRIPDNKLCRDIAQHLGHPILSTSIEFDDDDYARDPGLIAEAYHEKVDFILEGEDGDTIPSTIIDCTGNEPEIIRQGKGEI